MDARESALLFGDMILLLGIFPALFFLFDYGLRRPFLGFVPWWKSSIGWMFMVMALGFVATDTAVLMSIFLGPEYPGREVVRIIAFGFSTLASFVLTVVYLREKRLRGPRVVLHHENRATQEGQAEADLA